MQLYIRLILVLVFVMGGSIAGAQTSHFTFTSTTGDNATVAVPLSSNPNIGGTPLTAGDEIGVFTPGGLCVGAIVWDGVNNQAITVWGDDNMTPAVDGMQAGELMSYRVWDQSTSTEHINVTVTYSSGGPYNSSGQYSSGSLYQLTSLTTPALTYTLTVNTAGSGSVAKVPDQATYAPGTSVQLTATPAAGYAFVGWTGDLTGSTNPASIVMNANKTVTASFAVVSGGHFKYYSNTGNTGIVGVPVTANPRIGLLKLSPGDEIGVFTPGGLCVGAVVWDSVANKAITVWGDNNITPAVDGIKVNEQMFYRIWDQSTNTEYTDVSATYSSGNGIYSVNGTYVLSSLQANNTYTLTYTAGTGGTITGTSPQTVNHGGSGTPVTAVANAGYQFVNWSDGSTANPRTDVNVTANISVTANFNAAPVASNVNITGTPEVGQTLTGGYTYSDADGDAQGISTFRWLRNDVAIIGATALTYTIAPIDQGMTLKFEVTPVAQTGISPGVAVQSVAFGPVAIIPPAITNVLVDNTSIDNDAFVKNTDNLTVTATVRDALGLTAADFTADLG